MLIGTLKDHSLRKSYIFIVILSFSIVSNIIPTRNSTSNMMVRIEKGGGDGQITGKRTNRGTKGEDKKKCEKDGGKLKIS